MEDIVVSPEQVGLSSARLARIGPAVETHIGDDRVAGAVTLLARRGHVVHQECFGLMDRERDKPMLPDTIFRIYSMTKPITCVALMTLYEQGRFQLFDPVCKFIPRFADLKAWTCRSGSDNELVPLQRPVTVRDLLTHTSGLTYHFYQYGPVEEMYREAVVSSTAPLAEHVSALLELPLAYQPGTTWRYSVSHDVAAYLVEILSGQSFDLFLRQSIFEPLRMSDTGFHVPEDKLGRLAAMYGSGDLLEHDMTFTEWYDRATKGVNRLLADPADSLESAEHNVLRGGVGLVSTAADYWRFCQMLLNGGELDGKRVLGRKTVELMTTNHLAPELLPYELGGIYSPGFGYGLGFEVLMDVGQAETLGSVGAYGWGGAAATSFWIDPREELIGILMAQFQPSGHHLLAPGFRVAAYQAIAD
jgi:CubicO group peptidase (beta-lactamase class C family)